MNANPLPCARVRVLLEPYVDGDLARQDPALAAAVREHLGGCADCRRQHAQASSLPFRLKALTAPAPREALIAGVMSSLTTGRSDSRRAWILLAPEGVLVAFILWYLSGFDGLSSIASGVLGDLLSLGSGELPRTPSVDVLLLIALIALAAVAAYHLSVLIRLTPAGAARGQGRAAHE